MSAFLKRACNKGLMEVTGNRVNRGAGYGLEIPCKYHFYGSTLHIERLKTIVCISNVQMDLCDYCYKTNRWCTNLAAMLGKIVLMGIIWGRKGRPLYGIEGWPLSGGFLCTVVRAK